MHDTSIKNAQRFTSTYVKNEIGVDMINITANPF